MVTIIGPALSRRGEALALVATACAAVVAVVIPVTYLLVLPVACGVMAKVAPDGRRTVAALAGWVPLSTVVVIATGIG